MPNSIPSVDELLSLLVRCPSVNPGGARAGADTGEARMTALLVELLSPWTDKIEIVEIASGRSNLIARFAGLERSRCYAFDAHSDTVGIDGMAIEPFGADIVDGRLFGRGACDTKGPMAAMLVAILRHLKRGVAPACDILFLSTCDEELGGLGAKRMIEDGLRCDGIVVGEPTELRLIDCHKGATRFRLHILGTAAHSAYPELGANAIHAAARFISALEESTEGLAGTAFWSEPGPPTASVGVIRGGDQVNRIPDQAVLEIDFRVPPSMEDSSAEKTVFHAAQFVQDSMKGIVLEIQKTQHYPAFSLNSDSPFRDLLNPLSDSPAGAARYATNAGFYAQAGIPCVVFGPGSPRDAHTANESIALAELEEGALRLEKFLEKLRCVA